MVKVIIFDLWKTLAYKDLGNETVSTIKKRFCLKESHESLRKKFESALQTRKWKNKYSAYKFLAKKLGIKTTEENVNWLMINRDSRERKVRLYKYVIPLLRYLRKKGYKIVLLSNTSCFSVDYVRENTDLLGYVDSTMFSFEYGDVKPSLKGFRKILKRYRISAGEAVMIGDNPKDDMRPAVEIGMPHILYKSPRH